MRQEEKQRNLEKKERGQPEPVIDALGRACYTTTQAKKAFGVGFKFLDYWTEEDSRLRPGEKGLRFSMVPNPHPVGGPSLVEGYVIEDIQNIRDGKESDPLKRGTGRHDDDRPPGLPGDEETEIFLRSLLADGPMPEATVRQRAALAGITRRRLYRVKNWLKLGAMRHIDRGIVRHLTPGGFASPTRHFVLEAKGRMVASRGCRRSATSLPPGVTGGTPSRRAGAAAGRPPRPCRRAARARRSR
jgi:hypothetical protein